MLHINNKQNRNKNPIISRQDYHLTQLCPWEEKQTKTQHNSHPLQSLTETTGPTLKVKSPSRVWLFATQWTVALQAPLSKGFPRQESWSGLLFPSPGDLPNPGIKPGSPALQTDALPSNVTHFTNVANVTNVTHMNEMIRAMESPEASVTSLWETLTSFPWWESVLL